MPLHSWWAFSAKLPAATFWSPQRCQIGQLQLTTSCTFAGTSPLLLAGRSEETPRASLEDVSDMPCPCQHFWGLIQGPPHPVGAGEENSGGLKILEDFQVNIWIRGKPVADDDEGMLTLKRTCMESYARWLGESLPVVLCQHSLGTGKTHTGCCELLRSSLGGKQGKRYVPGVWLKEFRSTHRDNFLVTGRGETNSLSWALL